MPAATIATCVVIDDNEIDLYLTEQLVGLTKQLRLVASFTDAQEALHFLQAHTEVDLLLLAVDMPGLAGLQIVRQPERPHPAVIVISSHHDFAREAFGLRVADYLLKPVEYVRFQEAIRQLRLPAASTGYQPAPGLAPPDAGLEFEKDSHDLFVKVNNRLLRLNFNEVLYIEAMSTYSVLVTAKQKFIVHYTLKSIAERLPFAHFRRVHRSYIVNTRLIDCIEDNVLTLAGHEIPLAKSYQDELLQSLRSL